MQKPKSFRPWQPEQTTLLPPSPREWLADDHQVYFLLDLVDELDLSAILGPAEAKDPRGHKGFDPRMLTMLLLYAYCVGIVSSRKIERACYEDLAFRVLTGNQQPDHSRISEFRHRNLDALSHERMLRAEKELDKEINALMRRAEILDAQEDKRYGKGKLGSDLPDELRRRQDRLARIRQARKEMEAETAAATARQRQEEAEESRARAAAAREADAPDVEQAELNRKAETAAARAQAARDKAIEAAENAGVEPPDLELLAVEVMPRRGLARKADGTPTRKTQRNFTDPDSHLMQSGGSYLQGYNCQVAVDSDHQVIVAVGVSNQPPDVEHLEPMLQRISSSAGEMPTVMTMDAGYWSEDNAKACADQGIDAYIATGRLPHGQPPPPKRGPLPRDADAKTRMARKLRSKKGSKIYAQRKTIVEPVNGQIKEARGLRRFMLRGLEKVDGEWHLIAATHNLLKLFRYRRSEQQGLEGAIG
jgi:transposase